jgi:2',3'-cyclic-nucleotide 2'-phosphodiesterase (5'-nucleotidase family)
LTKKINTIITTQVAPLLVLTKDFLDILRFSGNLLLVELTNKEKKQIDNKIKKKEKYKSLISGFGDSFYTQSQLFRI